MILRLLLEVFQSIVYVRASLRILGKNCSSAMSVHNTALKGGRRVDLEPPSLLRTIKVGQRERESAGLIQVKANTI
jgi:hypothetical protein